MVHQLSRQGFSLVELSIVLVILGLLVGGILAGQTLIRAAELRSISSDAAKYNTAVLAFRDKYFAMPGDFMNAENFWGTAADCSGAYSTTLAGLPTCNGSGNGNLSWVEAWRLWQQLANAGLVEGQYTGVTAHVSDATFGIPGLNMPNSRISGAGFAYQWMGSRDGSSVLFAGNYGNALSFGAGNGVDNVFLTPVDTWNIDQKSDDGFPGSGKIRTYMSSSRPNCATSSTAPSSYSLSTTTKTCNLTFIPGF